MRRILIIHFNPLELYPPVQNFLRYASKQIQDNKIDVITTTSTNSAYKKFKSPSANIHIIRLGKSGSTMPALRRYMNYVVFYTGCLWYLLRKRPSRILYYETLSAFPVFAYKKFGSRSVEIFIHYHEYTSKEEYAGGTSLLNFFHRLEKKLYPEVKWLSHTNESRMEHFEKDIRPVVIDKKKVLPNYPSRQWLASPRKIIEKPVRIVYIGAISMNTMFTKEFAQWVVKQQGKVNWDIYSFNAEKVRNFFSELNCDFITLKEGVNYEELPALFAKYDVGVILYTAHIANYMYNAPNKLFEYAACGLDVWFPSVMEGSLPYITRQTYPKVLALDFTDLEHFNLDEAICRKNHNPQPASLFYEDVLDDLARNLR